MENLDAEISMEFHGNWCPNIFHGNLWRNFHGNWCPNPPWNSMENFPWKSMEFLGAFSHGNPHKSFRGRQLNAASRKSLEIQASCIVKQRTLLNRKFVCIKVLRCSNITCKWKLRRSDYSFVKFEFWLCHVKTKNWRKTYTGWNKVFPQFGNVAETWWFKFPLRFRGTVTTGNV